MIQPDPTETTESREVWPELLIYMESRVGLGESRYGTRLKTNNGRDALQDAIDEACDLLFYLMQVKMERELDKESDS